MNDYLSLSKLIIENNPFKIFKSANVGYNSTDKKNIKRVCDAIEVLSHLNSWNLKEGSGFFDNLKYAIIEFMELNGYELYVNANDKYKFREIKGVKK